MKYDAITEIFSNLGINIKDISENYNTKELIQNLKYFTKELNFELGNIEELNQRTYKYTAYKKRITINNQEKTIELTKQPQINEVEIYYQEDNLSIKLKFERDKVFLTSLIIKYPDGMYTIDEFDNKKINYYDKETIDYVLNKKSSSRREEYYLEQKSIEKYGLVADEEIILNDNNIEHIKLFKIIIMNTKEENKKLLEKMKKDKQKEKVLTKKIQ